MTTVDGVGASSSANQTGPTSSMKAMSPDDFIKLFLAQLTHQNPLKPADSSTMLQQMADISSIQASKDMQTSLANFSQSMSVTMGNSELMSATQMIGRNVIVQSDTAPLIAGKGIAGSVGKIPAGASDIAVNITNPQGQVVQTLHFVPGSSSLIDFKWDGKLADGTMAPAGTYGISATANVGGESKPCLTAGAFNVNSVAVDGKGNVLFSLDAPGGKVVSINDIVKYM